MSISKLGENIVIKTKICISRWCFFQKYLHNAISENAGKIGVLLSFEVNNFTEKLIFFQNRCMHIAATDPFALDVEV